MNDWITCTLNELGEIVGGATPSTKRQDYYEGNIPWITPKDLSILNGRYISRGERNITRVGLDSCSARLMPPNSVLFTSRAPIGYVAIAKNAVSTNQGFKSIVPNSRIDYLFLYYLLVYNKDKIEGLGSGTTFKEVSTKTMKGVVVQIPESVAKQKKIAAVLDSLDCKIEVNRRINDNLQKIAYAFYLEIFKKTESHSKPGILSEIATITMGQSPKGTSYNEEGKGEIFFQGRAEFGFRFPQTRLFSTEPKKFAEANDVLLSVRAPVGDVNVALERCCIGRGLSAIHSKYGHNSFVLYTLLSLKRCFDMYNSQGTVFGSINQDSLNKFPIDIYPQTSVEKFENIVRPIDNQIRVNHTEIQRLQTIRDVLLPRLMSGEIDVAEVEL